MRPYVHANSCVWTWLQGCSTTTEEGPLDSEVGGQKSRFMMIYRLVQYNWTKRLGTTI